MESLYENKAFRRRLLIFYSAVLAVLHIVFILLSFWDSYISADIAKQALDAVLGVIMTAIAVLLIYFRFGVLLGVYSRSETRYTVPFTAAAAISFFVSHAGEIALCAFAYSGFSENAAYYITGSSLSFAADICIMLILFLMSRKSFKKSKGPLLLFIAAAVVTLAVNLFQEGYYIVRFFADIKSEYGSYAISGEELSSIIMSVVKPVLSSACGFAVMLLTDKLLITKIKKQ